MEDGSCLLSVSSTSFSSSPMLSSGGHFLHRGIPSPKLENQALWFHLLSLILTIRETRKYRQPFDRLMQGDILDSALDSSQDARIHPSAIPAATFGQKAERALIAGNSESMKQPIENIEALLIWEHPLTRLRYIVGRLGQDSDGFY